MDKWAMFKNYMHNELGISKDDIRTWIKEAIASEARKMINDTFGKSPVDEVVKKLVRQEIKNPGYWSGFNDNIKRYTAEQIMQRLKIIVKEDQDENI